MTRLHILLESEIADIDRLHCGCYKTAVLLSRVQVVASVSLGGGGSQTFLVEPTKPHFVSAAASRKKFRRRGQWRRLSGLTERQCNVLCCTVGTERNKKLTAALKEVHFTASA